MWKFVNHICQYFSLFAIISRYFPVNATGMANMLICRHFANLANNRLVCSPFSDFIWDFGKLPFPTHLGKYFIKIGKIRAKIHEIGKIKAIFGLGMTPIYGLKNGQIKSLPLTEIQYPILKPGLFQSMTLWYS